MRFRKNSQRVRAYSRGPPARHADEVSAGPRAEALRGGEVEQLLAHKVLHTGAVFPERVALADLVGLAVC